MIPRLLAAALALGAALLPAAGCWTAPPRMPALATAQVAPDFDTYRLRRVGVMPFGAEGVSPEHREAIEDAFYAEVSQSTPYELVRLTERDLEAVQASDPFLRGWYSPETIIQVARRYSLDGVFFADVTRHQYFPPQRLSLSVDLVAAETGLVVWSSAVHLDATEKAVRDGVQAYFTDPGGTATEHTPDWELALLSPARFAQFAAYQVASLL